MTPADVRNRAQQLRQQARDADEGSTAMEDDADTFDALADVMEALGPSSSWIVLSLPKEVRAALARLEALKP